VLRFRVVQLANAAHEPGNELIERDRPLARIVEIDVDAGQRGEAHAQVFERLDCFGVARTADLQADQARHVLQMIAQAMA